MIKPDGWIGALSNTKKCLFGVKIYILTKYYINKMFIWRILMAECDRGEMIRLCVQTWLLPSDFSRVILTKFIEFNDVVHSAERE